MPFRCGKKALADKKRPQLDQKRFEAAQNRRSFSFITDFFDSQIDPLLDKLYDENFPEKLKPPLKNYLLVSLVSAMEYFFRNEARRIVDEYDKDITLLFSETIPIPIAGLDQLIREKSITKGNIVASSINFGNLDDIESTFSRLLNMNSFFDYVTKLERSNPSRYARRGHGPPIDIDIKKLREAYRLRNGFVHGMRQVELSRYQLTSRWDNAMNIMDNAIVTFDPTERAFLDEQVGKQTHKDIIKRKKRKDNSNSKN